MGKSSSSSASSRRCGRRERLALRFAPGESVAGLLTVSIKFVCSCGKHLRARDEMAARRSVCPRCGNPVGIPSLRPTHASAPLGPLSPEETRQRTRELAPPADPVRHLSENVTVPAPRPLDPSVVRVVVGRSSPRQLLAGEGRKPQTRWYHCLLIPVRVWLLLFGLAAALAGLTGGTVFWLPNALEDLRMLPLWLVLLGSLSLLVPFLVPAAACSVLESAFAGAPSGEVSYLPWPSRNLALVLKSGLTWLACFLAGPILPAASALLYWVNCGDMIWLDWLILAELGIIAVNYWLFAIAAVNLTGRLRDANPIRVAELIHCLGCRSIIAAMLASVLAYALTFVAITAVQSLQSDPAKGWLLLGCFWLSAMLGGVFLFRLLGMWCYRSR